MGGMLSQPITSKMLIREGNKMFRIGRSDMQGYRLNMEDAMTVLLGMGEGREDWTLFGVFDGHAGDRAAHFLAEQLHVRVCQLADPFDPEQLKDCVCKLDADFCSDPERREAGSTCVFCILRPTNAEKTEFEIIVSNTGDSRVVIIRKDTGECISMTSDHKPEDAAEHERIYAAGGTVCMNRTDGQLAMSRAIGDYQYKKDPDLPQDKQKVIPTPDLTIEKLVLGDTLLVMCDGIVEQMTNEEAAACVVSSMKEHNDPALAVAELFTRSLECGSKDNHSAILAVLEDGSDYGPPTDFVAGPYHPYKSDRQFADMYVEDAARYGIVGEKLFEAARKTEEKLGVFDNLPDPAEQNAGRQYLRLLQHIQENYNLSSMQLVGRGRGIDDMDDDDDDDDKAGHGAGGVGGPGADNHGDDDDDDDDDPEMS
jgi:protein phosphatase 2C family protein 2/3